MGRVGEARLLLLAALVLADELTDANEALQQERSRAQSADIGTDGVNGMSQRIEAIAARPEAP